VKANSPILIAVTLSRNSGTNHEACVK